MLKKIPFDHLNLRRKTLNTHLLKLLYVLFLFVFTGCAASTVNKAEQQGSTQLGPQEIFEISNLNTLRLISSDFDAHVYFSEDGSISASSVFNENFDYGSWDITSDSKLCLKFSVWYYGDANCYSIYKDPEKDQYLFFTTNGALAYTATVFPGNSQRMKIKTKKDKKPVYVRETFVREEQSQKTIPQETASPATPEIAPQITTATREEVKNTVKNMAQNCPGCNLEQADLRQAYLVGANLKGANLRGADLSRANLRRANLEGADLSGATLLSTNLPGANLKNSDLTGCDLTGSNLIQADFTGATMKGSILDNTLKEGAKGL